MRRQRERSHDAPNHESLVFQFGPKDTQGLQQLRHPTGEFRVWDSERSGVARPGKHVLHHHWVAVGAVIEDRAGRLGLHPRIHDREHGIVAVPLQGVQLTAGQRLAVAHIIAQVNARQCRRVPEYLGDDRDPIMLLELYGRLDEFETVQLCPPMSELR